MKYTALFLWLVASVPIFANDAVILSKSGVVCDVGAMGKINLGIPALDGRGTHLGPFSATVTPDGKALTAEYGHPFEGVALTMKVLDSNKVEYTYTGIPKDLQIVMCGFNVPETDIVPGLTVTFDQRPPIAIPLQHGEINKAMDLGQAHATALEIKWPTGESLSLTTPVECWHGIQDARVWYKKYISVCLTPSLPRSAPGGTTSTFVLTFAVTGASAATGTQATPGPSR